MRRIAPSGTPITLADLYAWYKSTRSAQDAMDQLGHAIRQYFGADHCFLISTGRAAMVLMLQSIAKLAAPEKTNVVIPSYTCYSVPSSVYKAELGVLVCDINPHTLDYDYLKLEKIDFSKVLAVVSSNLYGIPNDLIRLEKFCREKGVYLLDDAAQCMGARTSSGRQAGTFGDAGLFSLDKGKVITSINGGVIITNSAELASTIREGLERLTYPSLVLQTVEILKMFAYFALLRPSLYSIPAAMPFLHLGETVYTTDYPLERYNFRMAGMALSLLNKIDTINQQRIDNGTFFKENLPRSESLVNITQPKGCLPIYLRYPILVKDQGLRRKLLENLQRSGIDATPSYPTAIVDIPNLDLNVSEQDYYSGGRAVAKQIVTLPTHPYVRQHDRRKIKNIISKTLSWK